jgi:hypothetical protein
MIGSDYNQSVAEGSSATFLRPWNQLVSISPVHTGQGDDHGSHLYLSYFHALHLFEQSSLVMRLDTSNKYVSRLRPMR